MNKNDPLVTIAIPTYNRADGYLKETLQSAVAQSYGNIEIIVADNCSTDETESLVKKYNFPNLRYYKHKQNIGPQNNFNFCLDRARGVYFLLLHDDDLIDSDFVEAAMQAAGYREDIGVIRTGIRIIDATGSSTKDCLNSVVGLPYEQFILGWYQHRTAWYLANTLYNTEKLREIGGLYSNKQVLQDCIATAILAKQYGRIDLEAVKASVRRHSDEITFAVKVNDWCDDFIDFIALIDRLADKDNRLLYQEGRKFFAFLSYKRAEKIDSPLRRNIIYLSIYQKFKFSCQPPPIKRLQKKWGQLLGKN